MNKYELIELTLDKLIDSFHTSPESFDYVDLSTANKNISNRYIPTIIWRPKIELRDNMGTLIEDPNNCGAVMITFNETFDEITCHVFIKATNNTPLDESKADGCMRSRRLLEKWRNNYKKFCRLRNLIRKRDTDIDNNRFLRKLYCVFPDSLDIKLFK